MSTLAINFSVYDVLHRITYNLAIGLVQDSLPNLLSSKKNYLPLSDHALLNTYYEKRQKDFLLGRKALHIALSSMQHTTLAHEVQYGALGQPLLKNNTFFDISISHSASTGIAVVFPKELLIGVDLEQRITTPAPQITLDPNERKLFETTQLTPATYSILAWTIKESLGKSIKCGLNLSAEAALINSIKKEHENPCTTLRSTFKDFHCFTCYSFILELFIISITLPKHLVPCDLADLSRKLSLFFANSLVGAHAT